MPLISRRLSTADRSWCACPHPMHASGFGGVQLFKAKRSLQAGRALHGILLPSFCETDAAFISPEMARNQSGGQGSWLDQVLGSGREARRDNSAFSSQ